ncbi:MAG: N-acetyltransferase [Cyanothece sp. SIO2G6]|nr:N-acetyltransferase [Cyanothece sp. SIO2G6]
MEHQSDLQYSLTWVSHVADISQQRWNQLAIALKTPFFEWEWLNAMEVSGSVIARTGWQPQHLVVRAGDEVVAIAPLYVKGHSYGEFVFDQQWADLAYRLGVEYYPKLLGMSPFTPVEGYRFMIAPGHDEPTITRLMVEEIDRFCQSNQIVSCNFLYVDPEWRSQMESFGFIGWLHHSYIWRNHNYATFDHYLGQFNANQRRNIKRERKAIGKAGLQMKVWGEGEIPSPLYAKMYEYYSDTCDKFGWWGSKYLTRHFFEHLEECFAHHILFVTAYQEDGPYSQPDNPLGMSFCLYKGEQMYGRYWGSAEEIDCLHFNACYYTPIEWAIAQGVQTFDPGAGGRHKKRRGFPATPNHSLHRFYNDRLKLILSRYINEVNQLEQQEIESINNDLPLKQSEK